MFPGNRNKIAKSNLFKYAKEEQTDTKIKPAPVWSSSLLSNVNSFLWFMHKEEVESLTKQGAVFFRVFWLLFSQRTICFFSALQQTIASKFSQPMKTTTVYKDFINSLRQTRRFSLCYTHLCHTRWGLFPYNHSCVACTIARGVCILCLVIFIFFYCSSKPEVLKLHFVPAKSSCRL